MPKRIASSNPFRLLLDFFKKKLTVIGIIGQTQGVSKAIKPPKKPLMKIQSKESLVVVDVCESKLRNSSITGSHKSSDIFEIGDVAFNVGICNKVS